MMTTLAIAAMLGGYMFGMRFKIFILIPAIFFSVAAIFCVGMALDSGILPMVAASILAATGLQVGYFAARTVSFVVPRTPPVQDLEKLRWNKSH